MAAAGESTTGTSQSSSGNATEGAAAASQPIVTPPLASSGTFELYDPRGLLTRRRSQSRSSNAAASPGAERVTPPGRVPVRDRKDSSATQSSLTSVVEDDGPHSDGPVNLTSSPAPMDVPSVGTNPERGRLARLQISDPVETASGPSSNDALTDALTSSMPDLRARRADAAAVSRSQSPWMSDASSRARSPLPHAHSSSASLRRHYSGGEAYESGDSNLPTMEIPSGEALSPAASFLSSFSATGKNNLLSRVRSGSASTTSQNSRNPEGSALLLDATSVTQYDGSSTRRGSDAGSTSFMRSFIAPDPDEEGEEVDGYILEHIIGQGTFSIVRQARHVETGELVAVKIVPDVSLADPALQREVSIWSQLDQTHPYLLPLLHYYEDHIASYIFMPLCKRNLLQYVKAHGKGGSQTKKIFAQIVVGLRYLHTALNVTHKDIKLENILVDDKGNFKISDFGLAYAPNLLLNTGFTFDGTAGSLQYTSPEQIRSPSPISSLAVDIWALGCALYALIDGRLPFDDGFEPRLRVNIMKAEWKLPQALKKAANEQKQIEEVLRGCLELDVAKRWTIQDIARSDWL
ncbi:kinase-like protein, partial [Cystobasidium minutum MCA 4210]|uniref:kinase-like protein n=1 Tax=Cystobasidium minutum MCA 4210 TaxID=1397322 RepID=UPI0034CF1962|eukprot:jgi/Rhomi1/153306/estExt_Genewise1.C_4_t30369